MKRRFLTRGAIGIFALTFLIAWTVGVRYAHGIEIRGEEGSSGLVPAAWFEARPSSFADLAEQVQAAVVNISASKKVRGRSLLLPFPRFGPHDPFDDFFEKYFEGVPKEQTQRSLGSGFIIDKNGTILTNNHVVSQADEIEVALADGRKFKAKVVGVDEKTDIAVISIKAGKDLPAAQLGSSKDLRPGDWVVAIGNPFGLEHTVTVGVVSAKGRMIGGGAPYAKFIQTDASINPGNSGGPLFNMRGEVVGINTMIYAGGQGIGFAIPIDLAKTMIPQLVEKGVVSRGWLGVVLQDVTDELAKSFGLDKTEGVLIAEVQSGSPAAKGGLRRGDIVIEYNGEKVEDTYELSLLVGGTKPNTDVDIAVLRDGRRKGLQVRIGKQEGRRISADVEDRGAGKADALGLVARTLTMDDARELDLPANFRGVVIVRVEPGSVAEGADIRAGDVVLELNGVKIESMDDYKSATGKLKEGDYVRLFIKRGRMSIYKAFRL